MRDGFVYLKKRKSHEYVGQLRLENSIFIFTYNDLYLYRDRSISIGPDLPLTKKIFKSNTLFPSFLDRIPSKENPAYEQYCKMVGIDPSEKDPLILLTTIGHKDPSSFIFSAAPQLAIRYEDVTNFRKNLQLTVREFAEIFDFSPATITRLENKKISGKEALKRLEIYYNFPEIALFEAYRNQFKINEEKMKKIETYLKSQILDKSRSTFKLKPNPL